MKTALILSVLAPAVVATVLVALGHRLWTRSAPVEPGRWALALAPAAAAFAAYVAVRRFPELPPTDASEWALWMGAVAALFGVVDGRTQLPGSARWAARVLLSTATAFLVFRPLVMRSWDASTSGLAVVLGGAALAAAWAAIDRAGARLSGPAGPAALLVVGTGVAAVLGLSGSALFAQACGGVTVAFGVMAVAGFMRPELRLARSVAGPTALILGGFILAGLSYAEVSAVPAALLLLAAFTLLLGVVISRLPAAGLKGALAQGALAAVFAGAAIGLSAAPSSEPAAESGSSDGYDDAYDY